MKKRSSAVKLTALVISALLSAVTVAPAAVSATDSSVVYGDVNLDGKIDSSDATEILLGYMRLSTGADLGFTETQTMASELTGDGKIDASDATLLLQYYSYLSTGGSKDFRGYISDQQKFADFNGKWEGEKAVVSGLTTIKSFKGKQMYEMFALDINGDDIKLYSYLRNDSVKGMDMESKWIGNSLQITEKDNTALLTYENGIIKMDGEYSGYPITVYMKKVDKFTADFSS